MKSRAQGVLYGVAILLVLGIGGGVTAVLLRAREKPKQLERVEVGPLVNVIRAEREDIQVGVAGHGTVRVKVESQIVPQVSGRVVELHPNLISGGYIRANEPVLRIDDSDYKLALDEAATARASAEAELASVTAQLTEARARLGDARDDLERTAQLVASGATNAREQRKSQLAVDVAGAQLELAEAKRKAAESQLAKTKVQADQAKLQLERTVVTIPFNAMVRNESVDVGQFVTAGQPLATVYGTDAVEIPVPLEDEELKWFERVPLAHQITEQKIPRDQLPIADIHARFGGMECHWTGRVVRTEGTIDPKTRMVHVIVEVEDPLPVLRDPDARAATGRPPLIPGAFVDVEVRGKTLEGVFAVPRHALHIGADGGPRVWVAVDGKLEVRPVEVLRRELDRVYIAPSQRSGEGVRDGELVIITPLEIVNHGMAVRVPAAFSTEAVQTASDDRSTDAAPVTDDPGAANPGETIEVRGDDPAPAPAVGEVRGDPHAQPR